MWNGFLICGSLLGPSLTSCLSLSFFPNKTGVGESYGPTVKNTLVLLQNPDLLPSTYMVSHNHL